MMTSGAPVPAGQAAEYGLIDRIVEGDLYEGALAWTAELLADGAQPRRTTAAAISSQELSIPRTISGTA